MVRRWGGAIYPTLTVIKTYMPVLPTVTKIKFDEEGMFSTLQLQEWVPGFNHVGIDQLNIDEFSDDTVFLVSFLASCTESGNYDDSDVLSVKASADGILEKIYGPVILSSDEGELILRCGSNTFPIIQKGRDFFLGQLQGEIETYDIRINKDTPQEKTISVPRIDFQNPKEESVIYSVRILVKEKNGERVNGETIKRVARSGQSIISFLTIAKSGGVTAYKITEMPEGEYLVSDIDINEGGKYGNSYLIIIGDKGVWANKSLRSILDKNYSAFKKFLSSGKNVTLKIANIRDLDSGHKTCDAALFLRSPKAIASAIAKPQLPSATVTPVVIDAEVEEAKEGLPF